MSYTIVPYSPIIIPSCGQNPERTIYSPMLETFLYYKERQTNFSFRSVVDSGADFCVFPEKFAELVGIPVRKGRAVPTYGVGGKEVLYFHALTVGIIIRRQLWRFQCEAGFSVKMNEKGVGLLGRKGFFDLFAEVSFNQNKKMLKLKGEGSRTMEEE